jgi:hypothetical protein
MVLSSGGGGGTKRFTTAGRCRLVFAVKRPSGIIEGQLVIESALIRIFFLDAEKLLQ